MPRFFNVPLGKYGREYVPPVFALTDYKKLGISKGYYNKLKNQLAKTGELPQTIYKKLIRAVPKKERVSARVAYDDKIHITIPKNIISGIKATKKITYKEKKLDKKNHAMYETGKTITRKPEHIWIKYTLYKEFFFMKSHTLRIKDINKLSSFVNDYIDNEIRQYRNTGNIFITDITIQLV